MARPVWLTVPNVITLFRLALVPVFLTYHLTGRPFEALICFVIAAVSDSLDGLLARLLNQRSRLGALLDPVADKILVFCSLGSLMLERRLPLWLFALIVFRDGMMVIGAYVVRRKNLDVPLRPTRVGKYATFTLILLIVLALVDQVKNANGLLHGYTQVVGLIAGLAVVVSTVQYFARFGHLFFAPARSEISSDQ